MMSKGRIIIRIIAGIVMILGIYYIALPLWKRDIKYLINNQKADK